MTVSGDFLDELNDNHLYRTMGIRVTRTGDGWAESELTPQGSVCWPFPDQPHGGVLFTLMDTTMAWSVFTLLDQGQNCTTIDLNIHYAKPARNGPFRCRADVGQRTGKLAFVRAQITDADDNILAMGQGAFRVINIDPFA